MHQDRRFEIRLGPANISTDPDAAIDTLRTGFGMLAQAAGVAQTALHGAKVYLGLAGVLTSDHAAQVAQALPFQHLHITDDRPPAIQGALGRHDGAVIGLGTGSFIGRKTDGALRLIGGWGRVLGDEASGADLGRHLLSRVLHGVDGLAPQTALTRQILADMGGAAGIVAFAKTATPQSFADLAPRVITAASQGDAAATQLMAQGAAYITRGLHAVGWRAPEPICLIGGVARHYVPFLPPDIVQASQPPQSSALDGALTLAAQINVKAAP
jgi:glucosamine kinase